MVVSVLALSLPLPLPFVAPRWVEDDKARHAEDGDFDDAAAAVDAAAADDRYCERRRQRHARFPCTDSHVAYIDNAAAGSAWTTARLVVYRHASSNHDEKRTRYRSHNETPKQYHSR